MKVMNTARSKWIVVILLLETNFLIINCGFDQDDEYLNSRRECLQFERKTNGSKRHAVKSIQSEDGDVIDCIDIYKQPAFNHPALKNHTIQMAPTYHPIQKNIKPKSWTGKEKTELIVTSQLWQRRGITCPKGTIPIRRITTTKNFLTHNYARKKTNFHFFKSDSTENLMQANHSLAVILTEGFSYSGAKGDIGVWNPYVESDDEYSSSQISLRNGPQFRFEEIESGWAVNPSVYGDHQTRLFTYWTADASRTTGCFDLTCPGFVQTNNEIALGAAIYPISKLNGLPYKITIYLYKDSITNNWWLEYGEGMKIGYWPAELFTRLLYQAVLVQWGGEVYSSRVGTHPHTATAMGSGHFSDSFHYSSGYITRIRIQENGHELKFPEWVFAHSDEYECYDQYYVADYIEDPEFFYGGPGRNPMCP